MFKRFKNDCKLKPLCMPVEAFLRLSLKLSLWMFIRLAPENYLSVSDRWLGKSLSMVLNLRCVKYLSKSLIRYIELQLQLQQSHVFFAKSFSQLEKV